MSQESRSNKYRLEHNNQTTGMGKGQGEGKGQGKGRGRGQGKGLAAQDVDLNLPTPASIIESEQNLVQETNNDTVKREKHARDPAAFKRKWNALQRRIESLPTDLETYDLYRQNVSRHTRILKQVLLSAEAKKRERDWIRYREDGTWSDVRENTHDIRENTHDVRENTRYSHAQFLGYALDRWLHWREATP